MLSCKGLKIKKLLKMFGEVIMRLLCVMESLCDQWVDMENQRVENR